MSLARPSAGAPVSAVRSVEAIELRAANATDLAALRILHAASWRDAYAPFVPPDAIGRLEDHMAARWAHLPEGVTCACIGDRIVGFVRIKRRDGWPYIDNLHVAPPERTRGVGSVLLRAACARLDRSGAGRVWLTVIAANVAARRFYARHGGWEGAKMIEPVLGHPTITRPVIWNRLVRFRRENDGKAPDRA